METENPTVSDGGASITDRIAAHLSAQEAPIQQTGQESQETEPNAETQVDTGDGDQGQEAEPQTISTTHLAKYLGVDESMLDVDEDGAIKVKTKIDGKEGSAKFQDLLKDYQIRGHAENRVKEVAEKEKAVQARMQEVEQHFSQRMQYAEQLVNAAGEELAREYQSTDWEGLRQHDPGAWAAKREEMRERGARLQGSLQQIAQHKQHQQQQFAHQLQVRKNEEAGRLVELVPAWKDQAVFDKDSAEIWKLATDRGVPADMVTAIAQGPLVNAGLVSIMRDALEYQRIQSAKPAIENKLRLAPKLVKPGQSQAQDSREQKLQNLKQAVKKTGGKNGSVAAYLLAAGKV